MKQSTSDSIQHLKSIVTESTNKIEKVMRMKLLVDSDWSQMSESFRENAQKSVEQYFMDTIVGIGNNN